MSISSVNCTPIKPQVAFGNLKGVDGEQGILQKPEGVDEAQKVLQLSKELSDSFRKEDKEGEEVKVKHPLQTAVSLVGAALAMYTVGKGAGKAAIALSKKAPESLKKGLTEGYKNVSKWASKQAGKLPTNEKLAHAYTNTVGRVANGVKKGVTDAVAKNGAEKVFTTATGALAVATLVPKVAKADGNGDGIADIAQTGINAYQSAFKTAEIFADMIDAIA